MLYCAIKCQKDFIVMFYKQLVTLRVDRSQILARICETNKIEHWNVNKKKFDSLVQVSSKLDKKSSPEIAMRPARKSKAYRCCWWLNALLIARPSSIFTLNCADMFHFATGLSTSLRSVNCFCLSMMQRLCATHKREKQMIFFRSRAFAENYEIIRVN